MLRSKILLILGVIVFIGVFIFSFSKFIKAAQAPVLNNVSPASACGINLNFTAPELAARFEIQTSRNSTFTSPNLIFNATDEQGDEISGSGDLNAVTTSELLRDMGYAGDVFYNPNTRYYFRLRLVPSGGGAVSGWSNAGNALTSNLSAPEPPRITIVEGRDNGYKNYIAWERGHVSEIFGAYGGFEIWRAASSDGGASYGGFSLIQRLPATHNDGTPFGDYEDNDNGNWLNPDFSYKYYLKSFESDFGCRDDQVFISNPSAEVLVPVRPSGLTAATPSANRVELSWNDNSLGFGNETTFEIWRSVDNNSNFIYRYSAPADSENFTDSDVQPNKRYFYKVRGCQGIGACSAFSNEAMAETGIAPVDDLTARLYFADFAGSKADVYLSWNAVIGTTYTVLRKDVQAGTEIVVLNCSGNGISECRDSMLPFGKRYEYKLKIEKAGNIDYSNIVQINTDIWAVLKGVTWAWAGSGGVGWAKFRSDENSITKYSVQIDTSGLMSGAAWASPYYGWLSFNKSDLAGCPSGECEARLDLNSGVLNGWARFLSWDGWLKLKGENYGATFSSSTGRFFGAGWGNDILGWMAFGEPCSRCTLSADLLGVEPAQNHPPIVENVLIEAGPADDGWCDANPFYRIKWNYRDADEEPQVKTEIEFLPKDFATTTEGTDLTFRLYNPLSVLRPNRSYAARVRAYDGVRWSDWALSESTTTPSHYPPFIKFEWFPTSSIAVDQPVEFRDRSEDRSAGLFPRSGWLRNWDFQNGTPRTATGSEAIVSFSAIPSDVTLIVDDGGRNICGLTERVGGGAPPRRKIFRER